MLQITRSSEMYCGYNVKSLLFFQMQNGTELHVRPENFFMGSCGGHPCRPCISAVEFKITQLFRQQWSLQFFFLFVCVCVLGCSAIITCYLVISFFNGSDKFDSLQVFEESFVYGVNWYWWVQLYLIFATLCFFLTL